MNTFPFKGDMNNSSIQYMLEEWINTPELEVLVHSFGGTLQKEGTLVERVNKLIRFSDIWDFQSRQNMADIEKVRWTKGKELSSEQQKIILAAARKLGFIGCTMPSQKSYDYILVLGDEGKSCLLRMKYAKEICDKYGISVSKIVGLAGMKKIMKSGQTTKDTYASNAKTEFDLMETAIRKVFGSLEPKERKAYTSENSNKSWVREYYYNNIPIILLATLSEEPEECRINMEDTFTFFMKQLEVGCGINVLLVTSPILVPYQQLKAIEMLGIPYNDSVETIGFPTEWLNSLEGTQKPENYLQEIRAVLQVIGRLLDDLK
ncbi:MAG: hypothetical protein K2N51_03635 [Lachnospiraceae bacterium]|nr:hypothetical protein [Lachnospiraceae bacterium]